MLFLLFNEKNHSHTAFPFSNLTSKKGICLSVIHLFRIMLLIFYKSLILFLSQENFAHCNNILLQLLHSQVLTFYILQFKDNSKHWTDIFKTENCLDEVIRKNHITQIYILFLFRWSFWLQSYIIESIVTIESYTVRTSLILVNLKGHRLFTEKTSHFKEKIKSQSWIC